MKYAFFSGCLVPAREPQYENSVKKIAPELGIELVEMEGTNCCAPFSIQSLDYTSWLALAARNLCIAEKMGLNIVTLCNDCYESLLMTNTILKQNEQTREKVNEILAEVGLEFKGKTDVKIFSDVLYEDVGLEKVKNAIKRPFTGLRVAVQPGCHLSKPKRLHFEQWMGITALDELVEATGAKSVPYERKEACCGGPLRGINDEVALQVARQKLDSMRTAGVSCIVTVCPFCFLELDMGQIEIKRHVNEEYNLPVLSFAELLRLAMGMNLEDWELKAHRIPVTEIISMSEAK
ncbi:MAG TPA: CoB--CoM heterodisulfide reductase iron-sulfur subunit B family protein [Candidatus Acidoferrum sp.]|jgi:heterodisulfide reductase subunit B|nr:CoB--CoM heterodisulfide reductase iron-sulfur subunit B family protein [Candidatus Acidoferrum sp.]